MNCLRYEKEMHQQINVVFELIGVIKFAHEALLQESLKQEKRFAIEFEKIKSFGFDTPVESFEKELCEINTNLNKTKKVIEFTKSNYDEIKKSVSSDNTKILMSWLYSVLSEISNVKSVLSKEANEINYGTYFKLVNEIHKIEELLLLEISEIYELIEKNDMRVVR